MSPNPATGLFALRRTAIWGLAGIFCALCPVAFGAMEDREFRYIRTPEGVWVNEISGLVEDENGVIWASTWGEGLHRIDGATWRNYTEADGFVGDWQRTVSTDGETVWVVTADGLCRIRGSEQVFFTMQNTPSLASHTARSILKTQAGDLLVGTDDGYIVMCPASELDEAHPDGWQTVAGPALTGGGEVIDFVEVAPGHVWASIKLNGMLERRDGTWRRATGIPPDRAETFISLRGADGRIWAGHRYGSSPLLEWTADGWVETGLTPAGVRCFAADAQGRLLIGTDNGVWVRNGPAWNQLDLGPEIGTPNVQAILPASDGALWLGCQEGLARGTPRTWTSVRTPDLESNVQALIPASGAPETLHAIDTANRLWRFTSSEWRLVAPLEGVGPNPFRSTTPSRDGVFWAIGHDGVTFSVSLSNGRATQRIERPARLKRDPLMRLYLDPAGELFLHTDTSIYRLDGGTWEPLADRNDSHALDGLLSLARNADDTLYIGGHGGVALWDGKHMEALKERTNETVEDSCHTLLARQDGTVWMGTLGSGIYILRGSSLRRVTREQGLRTDIVAHLFEDSRASVWAAYRRQGLGRMENGHWVNYGYEDGLPNTAVLRVAEFPEGELWAHTADGGLYRFHPDTAPPETRIVAAPGRVDAHGVASFSFEGWDAWDDTPGRQLRYATRLIRDGEPDDSASWSGFDASTTLIPPALTKGTYRFEVRASDKDGNIDPSPAVATFTVLPPLIERPAIFVPLIIALLFFAVLASLLYESFQRLRRARLETDRVNQALLREITVRDQAEQALRRSEAHLEQAQALVRIGSWDLDPNTQVGTWSREMFNLFNRDPDGGAPSFRRFLKAVHPDDRKGFVDKHRRLFETGESFEAEFRSHPALGPVRHFYNHVQGLRDEDGRIRMFSGVTQDVTEERLAEEEHAALEERLRQSQKLEAVGQLVGGIAHDFNNILHALLGFTHMARHAAKNDGDLLDECLEGIDVAGNRAADLVRQLLTFSRHEKIQPTSVELGPAVEEALRLIRSTIPATVSIEYEFEAPLRDVFADATQIHQILMNLCTNAAQAMMHEGGTLRIHLSNLHLAENTMLNTGELASGDYVLLDVSDTGPGIEPDTLGRIFDPFFTTKEAGKGTGLGLTTVHGIVMSLGGGIAVESAPGEGARFRV